MRVLFISHDASRTGAPIVLLHFIRWIKQNSNFEFCILLKDSGHLHEDFSELGTTYLWNDNNTTQKSFTRRIFEKVVKKLFRQRKNSVTSKQRKLLYDLKEKYPVDLIYSNTVASHELLPILKQNFSVPIISHIHEMSFSINAFYPDSLNKKYIDIIDKIITVSKINAEQLIEYYSVPSGKISIVNEFIDVATFQLPKVSAQKVREQLSISDETFIVGGAGLTSWRKGIDLFVEVKRKLSLKYKELNIAFVWVGNLDKITKQQYEYELGILGNTTKIYFVGQTNCPMDYFQIFDVFLLSSREDPFPLVCLEAASLSKPLLCFEKAGGISEEFTDNGCITVPYNDLDRMAEEVVFLYENESVRIKIGEKASNMVKNFDVNTIAPNIVRIIEDVVNEK